MTLARRAATLLVLGLLPVVGLAGASHADAPVKTGWWNAASASSVALPLPTTGPDDLRVGQGPDGPTAYAAVAYDLLGQAIAGATLELKVVPNSKVGEPSLLACPTSDATWKAGGNQPIGAAPRYDCTRGTRGLIAADGTKVTFVLEVSQLLGQSYSLVLVPSPAAEPFAVDFAKPDATSLAPQPAPAPAAEPAPAAAQPPFVPPASSGVAPLNPVTVPQAPVFGAVQAPAPVVPVVPAPQAAPAPVAPPAAAARRPVEPASNRERYAAGTLLALMAGAAVWAFRLPAVPPRLLGGMARRAGPVVLPPIDSRPRGIGRFATLRTVPARPLL